MFKKLKTSTEQGVERLLSLQPYPTDSDYYQEAKTWYGEIYESLICSRDRYRLLAVALGILLAMCVTAIFIMMPLKNYFYRILTIHEKTGEVTQLKELEQGTFSTNWAVTRYFINQYIQNRNSYSYEDCSRLFNLTIAMTDKKLASEYSATMLDSNHDSPINVLGKDKYREVTVLSVNQLNTNTALVRFKIMTRSRANLNEVKEDDYQTVIKWDYRELGNSLQDRDKNPLGFMVTYYQTSSVLPEN